MPSRIKGITVEIGGDTTGLDKALRQVNTTIRQTQSSLRDVGRLLKLDPKNTELVAQKQQLLKRAIESTKEKLDALKVAEAQAKAQLEEGNLGKDKYDALEREIIATKEALKKLQAEAATTRQVFANLDALGTSFSKAGDAISGAGQKILPLSATIGGLGLIATKTVGNFDQAMSEVKALSGAAGDDFTRLRDKAREMGAATKFSATDAANAMGYMAQAGWTTEQMLDGIDGVMNLAASSGEDLAMTSDIVASSLIAFGLKAKDAGHFADVLAVAAAASNTDVAMMGETFKYAAPIAGALGFSVEEVSEAVGLLSNAGIKSTQAGTSLRTIMTSLSQDFQIAGKSIGEVTVKTTNQDGSMRSLNEILTDSRKAFSGLSESEKITAAESLVGKNAMSSFLALMNAAPEDIDSMRSALEHADGAAEEMAKVMQDNLPGQLEELQSQLEELAISLGDALVPMIREVISHIQTFIDKLSGMDEGTKNTIVKIGLFVAALGPALIFFGRFISGIGKGILTFSKIGQAIAYFMVKVGGLSGLFSQIGAALAFISAPVLAVVAAISVLVAAFMHLWNTSQHFRAAILATAEDIKAAFLGFGEGIASRLEALGLDFSSFGELIAGIWNGFSALLAPVFEGAFSAIAAILEGALSYLTGLFDIFSGIFTGNWTLAWTGIQEVFLGIWNAISGVFSAVWATIVGTTNTVLGWFGTNWTAVWTAIKIFFEGIWNGIANFFSGLWASITETVSGALASISARITSVFSAIYTTASSIWNSIKTTIAHVVSSIRSAVGSAFQSLQSKISSIFSAIRSTASAVWNGIKNAMTHPIETAKNIIHSIVERIKSFFSGLHISLPHIKLPHFSISGGFSIVPPRVPHLSIDWYKEGGIMRSPTLFGMNGSSLMAGGEAGSEAILPLKGFYDKLEDILTKDKEGLTQKYLAEIAQNSKKAIVLDTGVLVGAIVPQVDGALGARLLYAERKMT